MPARRARAIRGFASTSQALGAPWPDPRGEVWRPSLRRLPCAMRRQTASHLALEISRRPLFWHSCPCAPRLHPHWQQAVTTTHRRPLRRPRTTSGTRWQRPRPVLRQRLAWAPLPCPRPWWYGRPLSSPKSRRTAFTTVKQPVATILGTSPFWCEGWLRSDSAVLNGRRPFGCGAVVAAVVLCKRVATRTRLGARVSPDSLRVYQCLLLSRGGGAPVRRLDQFTWRHERVKYRWHVSLFAPFALRAGLSFVSGAAPPIIVRMILGFQRCRLVLGLLAGSAEGVRLVFAISRRRRQFTTCCR